MEFGTRDTGFRSGIRNPGYGKRGKASQRQSAKGRFFRNKCHSDGNLGARPQFRTTAFDLHSERGSACGERPRCALVPYNLCLPVTRPSYLTSTLGLRECFASSGINGRQAREAWSGRFSSKVTWTRLICALMSLASMLSCGSVTSTAPGTPSRSPRQQLRGWFDKDTRCCRHAPDNYRVRVVSREHPWERRRLNYASTPIQPPTSTPSPEQAVPAS